MCPCATAPMTTEHFLQHSPLYDGLRGDKMARKQDPWGRSYMMTCGAEEDSGICEGHWSGCLKEVTDKAEEDICSIFRR